MDGFNYGTALRVEAGSALLIGTALALFCKRRDKGWNKVKSIYTIIKIKKRKWKHFLILCSFCTGGNRKFCQRGADGEGLLQALAYS